jgi:hypothetical protein
MSRCEEKISQGSGSFAGHLPMLQSAPGMADEYMLPVNVNTNPN